MSAGTVALRRSRPTHLVLLAPAFASLVLLIALLGALAGGQSSSGIVSEPSAAALADIPSAFLPLYQKAGADYGVDWAILAAIGAIETDHGRSLAPGVRSGLNAAGCCAGPMQFNVIDGIWSRYATDGNGDGSANVYEPADAITAAARFLRANGAPRDNAGAIFSYNRAGWYVAEVLSRAAAYRGALANANDGSLPIPEDTTPLTLLASQNFSSYNTAWTTYDLDQGFVDPRLVAVLSAIVSQHRIGVWAFKTGHPMLTATGQISNHYYGRAVDVASVDGQACDGTSQGTCGRLAIQLAQIHGPLRISELIYCFDPDPASPDNWAAADHCDHLHVGYEATPSIDP